MNKKYNLLCQLLFEGAITRAIRSNKIINPENIKKLAQFRDRNKIISGVRTAIVNKIKDLKKKVEAAGGKLRILSHPNMESFGTAVKKNPNHPDKEDYIIWIPKKASKLKSPDDLVSLNHEVDEAIETFKKRSTGRSDSSILLVRKKNNDIYKVGEHTTPDKILKNEDKLSSRLLPYDQTKDLTTLRNYRNKYGETNFSKKRRQFQRYEKRASKLPKETFPGTYKDNKKFLDKYKVKSQPLDIDLPKMTEKEKEEYKGRMFFI